jgi:hypothetical protein
VIGHGAKFDRRKEQAIAALLIHPTLPEASVASGISISTLRRWRKNPIFEREYEKARRALLESAANGLRSRARGAADILWKLASDANTKQTARVSACRAIIDLAFHSAQLQELNDISERLRSLEDAQCTKI